MTTNDAIKMLQDQANHGFTITDQSAGDISKVIKHLKWIIRKYEPNFNADATVSGIIR
jgi:hypothetical protein